MLSQYRVTVSESVSKGGGQALSAVPLLFLRQSLMRSLDLWRKTDAEDLPVILDLHSDLTEPLLNILQQLPQLSLVGAEDREVVHLPQIVRHAVLLLMDHQV